MPQGGILLVHFMHDIFRFLYSNVQRFAFAILASQPRTPTDYGLDLHFLRRALLCLARCAARRVSMRAMGGLGAGGFMGSSCGIFGKRKAVEVAIFQRLENRFTVWALGVWQKYFLHLRHSE